jgi:DnaA family protein
MDTLNSTPQLTLNLSLRSEASLQNFYGNPQLIHDLSISLTNAEHGFIYLWGENHSGRTHLAHAYCHSAEQKKISWMYLSLNEITNYTPEIFEGLENYSVLVLDDINILAGKTDWEEALFHLYNRGLATQQHLLITANCAPAQLAVQLPDLLSRLKSAVIFKLQNLNEKEKLAALITRANERGWQLPNEVGEFLLRRWPRDLVALFSALESLDKASLQQKRRVTIPLAKEVLGL